MLEVDATVAEAHWYSAVSILPPQQVKAVFGG